MSSVSAQDRFKAELLTEISKLEADITQWDDLLSQFAKPLVTGMPNPFDVASSVPAPPQLFGLPKGRSAVAIGSRERSSENITFEAPSTILLPRMRRRV
ncbi:hypothetical protein DPMN_024212 [Dreissena polymorpha]|uniref:Uncharacterized protein n=1 Tax=Dreissena polymorpha TaxID=45954 RepID=A0A9D4RCH5_DREPO|nr:hypothetical protein DPMN_024212 [Dreissena polymorpha]